MVLSGLRKTWVTKLSTTNIMKRNTATLNQARHQIPRADEELAQRNFRYDLERFLKYSSAKELNYDPVSLEAYLTSAYHALEKGLAFEKPRAGYGQRFIRPILEAIDELERRGRCNVVTRGARGCLQAYVRYHDERGLSLPPDLDAELREFVNSMDGKVFPGGTRTLTLEEIKKATDFDYARFVNARWSVRHFTGESVSSDTVRRAIEIALKTPRTCNREMRHVYAAYEPELRDQALSLHFGNRGFGDKLGALLVVTCDLRALYEIAERNQAWIDGGLFAMSLVYALHASSLGTCMLNWSVDCDHDKKFRRHFRIPDNEVIITFIGVGVVPDSIEVAASPSPPVEEVYSLLKRR